MKDPPEGCTALGGASSRTSMPRHVCGWRWGTICVATGLQSKLLEALESSCGLCSATS